MELRVQKLIFVIASALTIISMVAGFSYWATKAVEESEKRDREIEIRIEYLEQNNKKIDNIENSVLEIIERLGVIEANQKLLLEGKIERD